MSWERYAMIEDLEAEGYDVSEIKPFGGARQPEWMEDEDESIDKSRLPKQKEHFYPWYKQQIDAQKRVQEDAAKRRMLNAISNSMVPPPTKEPIERGTIQDTCERPPVAQWGIKAELEKTYPNNGSIESSGPIKYSHPKVISTHRPPYDSAVHEWQGEVTEDWTMAGSSTNRSTDDGKGVVDFEPKRKKS